MMWLDNIKVMRDGVMGQIKKRQIVIS